MQNLNFTSQQMRDIIEGKRSYERIPMVFNFWAQRPEIFGKDADEAIALMKQYPYDIQHIKARMPAADVPPEDDENYTWIYNPQRKKHEGGLDSNDYIGDWDELDEIIKHFPNPMYPNMFPKNIEETSKYRMVCWWFCFFEQLWYLRGMENALTDFYLYPDQVHRLFQTLTDFYKCLIQRAHDELHADAVFTSDDVGTQTGPFFSEEIFTEFFKPYYKQLIEKAHSLGMHFWLHTCGNVQKFIPHYIDIGLDVLHPIQKYTMDEAVIAKEFGDKICIWAGFDVQRTIPFGTPEDVRREVRFMIDTYARKDGRLMLTCGNGLTEDCKIESFRALLDESYHYGLEKMKSFR